jgi:hypothetical protein
MFAAVERILVNAQMARGGEPEGGPPKAVRLGV